MKKKAKRAPKSAVRKRIAAAETKRLWRPLTSPFWGATLGAIAFPVLFWIEQRIVLPLLPISMFDGLTRSDGYVLLAMIGATYGFVAVMVTKFLKSLKRPVPPKDLD